MPYQISALTHHNAFSQSKLHLVDLAGSERSVKTQSTGVVQKEAKYINKSLSFLEQVVLALTQSKREHIPYRQSKLTYMLKDSLVRPNSTWCIIIISSIVVQLIMPFSILYTIYTTSSLFSLPPHSHSHSPSLPLLPSGSGTVQQGGNCLTVMIACVWPHVNHLWETFSTLKVSRYFIFSQPSIHLSSHLFIYMSIYLSSHPVM